MYLVSQTKPALSIFSQRTAHQSHAQQAKLRDLENQIDGLRNTLKEAEAQAVKVITSLVFCFVLFLSYKSRYCYKLSETLKCIGLSQTATTVSNHFVR